MKDKQNELATIEPALPEAKAGSDPCQRIHFYHQLALKSAALSAMAAIAAGLELLRFKASCRHGEFLPYVEDKCGFGETTARRYMKLAMFAVGEGPALALAVKDDAAIGPVVEKSAKNLDGKGLRQIYQEAGIIKVSDNCGGSRNGAGRPRKDAAVSPAKDAETIWAKQVNGLGNRNLLNAASLLTLDSARAALALVEGAAEVLKKRIKEG